MKLLNHNDKEGASLPFNLVICVICVICGCFSFLHGTVVIASGQCQSLQAQSQIETTYNQDKDLTTVKLPVSRISDDRDRYRSLDFSVFYTYPGREKQVPSDVHFELVSVVKARKLNTDLYVVFVIDGEKIHFSSNRSAIFNPVPGRLWIGERMVFRIPYVTFKKLAAAKHLAIKMGPTNFDLSEDALASIRQLADTIGHRDRGRGAGRSSNHFRYII